MKVVAYQLKPIEKFLLAQANKKKHDITFISDSLGTQTALYAQGKQAVIVSGPNDVTDPLLEILAKLGIRYIVTRLNSSINGISERGAENQYGILWASVTILTSLLQEPTEEELQQISFQTISLLDNWNLPTS